jgi:hypothetical protein
MDEATLNALRQDPPAGFASRLRARLDAGAPGEGREPGGRVRRIVAPMLAAAAVLLLFSIPAVRASAQSFLSLFRVVNFVAVTVDPARFEALGGRVDIRGLIGEQVQVVRDPGPPTPVVSLEQAAAAVGYPLRLPQWLPEGARVLEIEVSGEGLARVTADAARLDALLDTFGIRDLRAPEGLDGQVATVHVPRGVMVRYEHGRTRTRFVQAPSPVVDLPVGVPLAALGEIALRLLSVPAADARRFAAATDWTSTLIVPISPDVRSVRPVTIAGHSGLALDVVDQSPTQVLLWSDGERVFGIVSLLGDEAVLEMANSVR